MLELVSALAGIIQLIALSKQGTARSRLTASGVDCLKEMQAICGCLAFVYTTVDINDDMMQAKSCFPASKVLLSCSALSASKFLSATVRPDRLICHVGSLRISTDLSSPANTQKNKQDHTVIKSLRMCVPNPASLSLGCLCSHIRVLGFFVHVNTNACRAGAYYFTAPCTFFFCYLNPKN